MKIEKGSVKSACEGSQLTTFAASEDAKIIGAVSPATRATASKVPVTIPPERRRDHDLDDGLPFACAESGTCIPQRHRYEPENLLRRAGDQRDFDDRERDPGDPGRLTVADDEQTEDEDPDHDRRARR